MQPNPTGPGPTEIDDAVLADLRRLDLEATPPGWAWRQAEVNARPNAQGRKRTQSQLLMALAGFHENDELGAGYFYHTVFKVRWDDIKARRTLYNATPKPADAELIPAMRNALPGLLDLIDSQRRRISQLEGQAAKEMK